MAALPVRFWWGQEVNTADLVSGAVALVPEPMRWGDVSSTVFPFTPFPSAKFLWSRYKNSPMMLTFSPLPPVPPLSWLSASCWLIIPPRTPEILSGCRMLHSRVHSIAVIVTHQPRSERRI